MENINDFFETKDLTDYAAIPFWSWNNKLEEEELLNQIRQMKEVGLGGFVMHARTGLKTPYLGEEWMHCVEVGLDEAKKLKMNAWIYDENGWPSGFVGGELLKERENLALYLEMEEGGFNENAYAVFVCTEYGYKRVETPCGATKYYNVKICYSKSNTDILNPAVVTKFINLTHEKYYERFANRFGKELVGFFTDEPQYYRNGTPFSFVVEDYFREKYGENVKDGIIHLFFTEESDYAYRVKYYSAMNDLYTNNYYKRIYNWCKEHGCQFTGHSIEENYLFTQMWGGAACTPSYEYQSIPGIDNLGKYGTAGLSARQIGSVAQQLNKKHILTETFGCSGYDASPRILRNIAEKQFVHGVNLMCHHLYSYSLAGQGKTDHPPCFSKHITWWKDFKKFNTYFTRLGYMIAEGRDYVNAAILSPMTSIYLNYLRLNEKIAAKTDEKFRNCMDMVNSYNIEYHILDEKLLKRHGSVEGDTLNLGTCKYKYVIIPYCPNMYSSTYRLLHEYVKNGGKIILLDEKPEYVDGIPTNFDYLISNTTLKEIKETCDLVIDGDPIEFTHRRVENLEYIFAVNDTDQEKNIRLSERYALWDILSGETKKHNGNIALKPYSSVFLVKDASAKEEDILAAERKDISSAFSFQTADNNNLTLDFIQISKDGTEYSSPRYVYDVFDELVKKRYEGDLWVKYSFEVESLVGVRLRIEKNKGMNYSLNGNPLRFERSLFDSKFVECDVTSYIKEGVNEFSYKIYYYQSPMVAYALYNPEATESLRNCLSFDTEIEPIYLLGDFSVKNRKISAKRKDAPIQNLTDNGYPFFAGEVVYSGKFNASGEKTVVCLEGIYMSATVTVNGKVYDLTMDNETVVDTVAGENYAEIRFTASLHNMFGPLHWNGKISGVGPVHFRIPNGYEGNKNSPFTADYKVEPFGVRVILKN